MNKFQNQTLKMFQVISEFLDGTESSILDGLPGFQEFKDKFNLNRTNLRSQHELQSRNITGFALDKKEIRTEMTEHAVDISNKIVAYGTVTNNTELVDDMHYTKYEFKKMSDNEFLARSLNIHSKAVELLPNLGSYNVTADLLTSFNQTINNFEANLVKPITEINTVKLATAEIANLFDVNKQLLIKMDRLVLILKNTNPEFVKGYFESRNLDQPSGRPYSIRISVVDSESNAVSNVLVENKTLGIRRRTRVKGLMFLRNIEGGDHEFTFTKAGYITQNKIISVNPNERADVTVVI